MKKYIYLSLAISIFTIVGTPSFVFGHGEGLSLQKDVGEYSIDVDANEAHLKAGNPIRFSFNISAKEDTTPLPKFTDAWVRISPQDSFESVFAGNLSKPDFGPTGMTYVFPRGGEYELLVRFQNNGSTVAEEVAFSLEVENDPDTSENNMLYLGLIAGLIIGGGLIFSIRFLPKRK